MSTTVWAVTVSSAGGSASTTAGQMVLSIINKYTHHNKTSISKQHLICPVFYFTFDQIASTGQLNPSKL